MLLVVLLAIFLPITSKTEGGRHFKTVFTPLFVAIRKPFSSLPDISFALCSAGPLVGLQILSGREFSSNPIPFEAENFASIPIKIL